MKNLDLFRQPRVENVKSTVYGGIISLFSLLLLVYGIYVEVNSFVGTTVDVEVAVENHPMAERTATIELNLTVYDVSCLLLNPMLTSEVSDTISSVEGSFKKTRIFEKDGVTHYVDERDLVSRLEHSSSDQEFFEITNSEFVEGESCNMYAELTVPKIEGSISVFTLVNPQLILLQEDMGHNILIKNHRFHSLKFKNGAQGFISEEQDQHFASEFHEDIDLIDRIKEIDPNLYTNNSESSMVTYFAEVIPHVLYDDLLDIDLYSYSYSLNHHIKYTDNDHLQREELDHGILLKYDFSPLTMRLMKKSKPIGKLAINI